MIDGDLAFAVSARTRPSDDYVLGDWCRAVKQTAICCDTRQKRNETLLKGPHVFNRPALGGRANSRYVFPLPISLGDDPAVLRDQESCALLATCVVKQ